MIFLVIAGDLGPPLAFLPATVISDVALNTPDSVAGVIDHTLLKPEATQQDIARVCEEAGQYRFASVCINPFWVRFAAESLAGSSVRVCTVIGFPLGANEARTKIAETELALLQGAHEIDMVQNIGALRSGQQHACPIRNCRNRPARSFAGCSAQSHSRNLFAYRRAKGRRMQPRTGCASRFREDFDRFLNGGATVADVELMRRTVGTRNGRQSLRRNSHAPGFASNGLRWGEPYRRKRWCFNRPRTTVSSSSRKPRSREKLTHTDGPNSQSRSPLPRAGRTARLSS